MREQVEVYLGCSGKGREALTTCAEILDAWCISKPTEGDIERLKAELLAMGKAKQTVANWLSTFRKFLNWRQTQEGEAEQMSLGFDEQERAGQQNEPETLAVIENTSTGEEEDTAILEHEPVEQEHTPITGTEGQDEPDTHSLPVDAEPQAQAETPKPKNKGGRKVLDPNGEKRSEKVMLYLTPSLMDDLRDLAYMNRKSIADYVISLIERNNEQKQAKLALFRELQDSE